jgi:hypothetical protein
VDGRGWDAHVRENVGIARLAPGEGILRGSRSEGKHVSGEDVALSLVCFFRILIGYNKPSPYDLSRAQIIG